MRTPSATALAFVSLLLLLQFWLLSGAIEAALGPEPGGLAATLLSGGCFLAAWGFLRSLRWRRRLAPGVRKRARRVAAKAAAGAAGRVTEYSARRPPAT